MALLDTVYVPEPLELAESPSPLPHSRYSGTTLNVSGSEQSYPTEPLLYAKTPDTTTLLPEAVLTDEPEPIQWRSRPSLLGDPPSLQERRSYWERILGRRLKRLRYMMRSLKLIFASWAIYNTARYFITFASQESKQGQIVSLVLGICTCISFALLVTAEILSFFQLHLLMHSISLRILTLITTCSLYLSSITLLAPAIVNLIMLCVWRNSSNKELSTEIRCHIDIDVIWSVSKQVCSEPYSWGALVALATTRLGITAVFIALYYAFLLAYHRTLKTRKPSKWINPIHLSRHRQSSSMQAAVPPYVAEASSRSLATTLQQQTSISTIISASPSQKSQNTSLHLTRSRPTSTDYHTPLSISLKSNYEAEQETAGTLGRIRSLVSQPREVDHAAVSAHSDNLSDSSSDTHYSNDDSLNLDFPPVPTNIGYNEFGEPYPPEESIPMFNGFVRRMPTIESMGSRELASTNQGSSVYSGSAKDRLWVTNSGSRSPTRVSLSSPIDAPSRPSSLSMRVSDIIGSLSITGNVVNSTGNASEVGELIRPVNEKRNNPPSPSRLSHCINSPSPHPSGTQNTSSQSSWASTVPTTYYTATMSSRSSVPYSVQEEDPDL